jgi:hypothetical protein
MDLLNTKQISSCITSCYHFLAKRDHQIVMKWCRLGNQIYSIITAISECVPNLKLFPMWSVNHVLWNCLFLGTTVHKRNRVRLLSGVSTYHYALPSACYFMQDFVTLVYQFQELSMCTADELRNDDKHTVDMWKECEYGVGMWVQRGNVWSGNVST